MCHGNAADSGNGCFTRTTSTVKRQEAATKKGGKSPQQVSCPVQQTDCTADLGDSAIVFLGGLFRSAGGLRMVLARKYHDSLDCCGSRQSAALQLDPELEMAMGWLQLQCNRWPAAPRRSVIMMAQSLPRGPGPGCTTALRALGPRTQSHWHRNCKA